MACVASQRFFSTKNVIFAFFLPYDHFSQIYKPLFRDHVEMYHSGTRLGCAGLDRAQGCAPAQVPHRSISTWFEKVRFSYFNVFQNRLWRKSTILVPPKLCIHLGCRSNRFLSNATSIFSTVLFTLTTIRPSTTQNILRNAA